MKTLGKALVLIVLQRNITCSVFLNKRFFGEKCWQRIPPDVHLSFTNFAMASPNAVLARTM
jgi:hypothetical protein